MSQQILDYFRKHKQLINENLSLCEDPANIEAIHDLRLSIKRLRVVARLCDRLSDGSFEGKEKLHDINKLFKRSGRLRDIQVTRILLAAYEHAALQPVIEKFDQRELRQRLKFEQGLESFNMESLDLFEIALTDVLAGISGQQLMHAGLEMLSGLEMEVHELFHGSSEEKRLHDVRTRLKDINYLNNIFEEQLPVQDQLNVSIDRLREIGEIAGSWHDCLNLEGKLEKYIRKNPVQTGPIRGIISELTARKQGLLQEYTCTLINEMKI